MQTPQISRNLRLFFMSITIAAVTAFGIYGAGWATPAGAQGTVPGRQQGGSRQPPGLAIQEQGLPRLLGLPVAVGQGDQFLAAVRCGPQQDQDALPVVLQAEVEVHAVGPDVDVMPTR